MFTSAPAETLLIKIISMMMECIFHTHKCMHQNEFCFRRMIILTYFLADSLYIFMMKSSEKSRSKHITVL